MSEEPRFPVCVFLVPVVRDGNRKPHQPILWRMLQDALVQTFGSVTGPETVIGYRSRVAVRGVWSPDGGEDLVEDLSRRYTIAIPAERVPALKELLRRAGNSFDQRVMYLEVAGYAELLEVRPEDGFLDV